MRVLLKGLLGIEVGHTFTANCASEDVLMSINQSVDTGISEFLDHLFDSLEVDIVIDAFFALNGFPHDTETDEVHSPLLEEDDILVVEGVLGVEITDRWDIRVDLVDNVDTMEKNLTSGLINEGAVGRVDIDSL